MGFILLNTKKSIDTSNQLKTTEIEQKTEEANQLYDDTVKNDVSVLSNFLHFCA